MVKHICVLALVFLFACFISETTEEFSIFYALCEEPTRLTSHKFEHKLRSFFQKGVSEEKILDNDVKRNLSRIFRCGVYLTKFEEQKQGKF
jgi:hypothetical protein